MRALCRAALRCAWISPLLCAVGAAPAVARPVQSHSMIRLGCTPYSEQAELLADAKASGASIAAPRRRAPGGGHGHAVRPCLRLLEARRSDRPRPAHGHPHPRGAPRHTGQKPNPRAQASYLSHSIPALRAGGADQIFVTLHDNIGEFGPDSPFASEGILGKPAWALIRAMNARPG